MNAKLEEIDGETDNLDITFVKMADPRYARKWGVTKLPAIVHFRKRFPSIYRGERLRRIIEIFHITFSSIIFYLALQVTRTTNKTFSSGCGRTDIDNRN